MAPTSFLHWQHVVRSWRDARAESANDDGAKKVFYIDDDDWRILHIESQSSTESSTVRLLNDSWCHNCGLQRFGLQFEGKYLETKPKPFQEFSIFFFVFRDTLSYC